MYTVTILMGTFNGAKFLRGQLQSIEDQSYKNWRIVISDDGSADETLDIICEFQERWSHDRLEFRLGPRKGFCQNFLSMACDTTIKSEFYAYCDQDDIWLPDKLSIAIEYFLSVDNLNIPNVYSGRTYLVDEKLNPLGLSPLFGLQRSFRNALVQSIAGGNTMVFNKSAKKVLENAGIQSVISHDWWTYQIITGVGGIFYYDKNPTILYRQHRDSLIGSNQSIQSKFVRFKFAINGRFKSWNTRNCAGLQAVSNMLTVESKNVLNTFSQLREASFYDRIRLLEVCGLYRQSKSGTVSLWLAIIINKI